MACLPTVSTSRFKILNCMVFSFRGREGGKGFLFISSAKISGPLPRPLIFDFHSIFTFTFIMKPFNLDVFFSIYAMNMKLSVISLKLSKTMTLLLDKKRGSWGLHLSFCPACFSAGHSERALAKLLGGR